MGRRIKITWEKIYKDFRVRYPKLAKEVLHFQPYDYATILLMFPDHVRMIYNYDTKRAEYLVSRDI